MRFTLILLAAVVAMASALPRPETNANRLRYLLTDPNVSNRNSALEEMILAMLEDLRETMINGSDDIPVLDPLHIEHIHVDDTLLPLPGAHVTLNDMKISDLSTFEIDSLNLTMTSLILQRYRLQIDGYIPVLNVDTKNYDLFLNVFGLNIFGNGEAKLAIVRPRIILNTLAGIRLSGGGIYLNLIDFNIAFSLKDFIPQITGLFNDQATSDFVSLFLQNLVTELLEFYEVEINEFLSVTIHEAANEFLADFNLIDILG